MPNQSPAKDCAVRIAVIGDPHFVPADHSLSQGSHLKFDSRGSFQPNQISQNPWASLQELVNTEPTAKSVDLVICAGDLSTGGDKFAIDTGWKHLVDLAKKMEAKVLACATGNHDVRSRSQAQTVRDSPVRALGDSRGLNENLRNLEPPYPIVDLQGQIGISAEEIRTRYFGDYVVLVTTSSFRLVVFNSCCEHTADNVDFEKGAFPESAKRALLRALEGSREPLLNILVCHHPPTSHGYFGENNYDFISGGGELLSALEEHGSWLVIHGHKHHGHITYAPGGGRSPIVFAAASLSAHLPQVGNGHRNQFYILEIEAVDDNLRGKVNSWDWNNGLGYSPSTRKLGGIFNGCGFGHRRSPSEMAEAIASVATGRLPISWADVRTAIPDLAYVIPTEYPLISKILNDKYSIAVEPDQQENWNTLAKAVS